MGAVNYDLLFEQGATFLRTITVKDGDGVVKNLTGHTFKAEIRKSYGSSVVVKAITIAVPTPTNGKVNLSLTATETAALPVEAPNAVRLKESVYAYDLIMTETATGYVTRLLQGAAIVSPRVTT